MVSHLTASYPAVCFSANKRAVNENCRSKLRKRRKLLNKWNLKQLANEKLRSNSVRLKDWLKSKN